MSGRFGKIAFDEVGQYRVVKGTDADAGWWLCVGPGETRWYLTEVDALRHAGLQVGEAMDNSAEADGYANG